MILVGVDVFLYHVGLPVVPEAVAGFRLENITNRGIKVYPGAMPQVELVDLFRARYMGTDALTSADVERLLAEVSKTLTWVDALKLFTYDGQLGYTAA